MAAFSGAGAKALADGLIAKGVPEACSARAGIIRVVAASSGAVCGCWTDA